MTAHIATTRIAGRPFSVPRWINIVMGAWLVASAFLWPQPDTTRANHTIVGVLIATIALYAIFVPALRKLNTVLALWLLASSLLLFDHVSPLTMWNDVVIAVIVFAASLPRGDTPQDEQPPPHSRAI